MISVKNNTDLILHGGVAGSTIFKEIWRYRSNGRTWNIIGSMMMAKKEHSGIPVEGLECH